MTGTVALGFKSRNSELSVAVKPEPQSSRSKASPTSSQVHRTFRTLIEDAFPSTRSMGSLLSAAFGSQPTSR